MVEILKSFEQVATRLRPAVLVLPGLSAAALGLFIWLGGLGFRRSLLAVIGTLTGAGAAFCVLGRHPGALFLLGLLGAFVALVFQRFFMAALLAGLAGIAAFGVVAWPHLKVAQGTLAGQLNATEDRRPLTTQESLETVRLYLLDLSDASQRAGAQLVASRWAVVAAAALVFLLIGLLFRHLGGALACAIFGTTLIFSGLVSLLWFKGAGPVTRIEARASFFGLVFAAMVAFGAVEQWILLRRADARQQAAGEKTRPRKSEGKRSWRGR